MHLQVIVLGLGDDLKFRSVDVGAGTGGPSWRLTCGWGNASASASASGSGNASAFASGKAIASASGRGTGSAAATATGSGLGAAKARRGRKTTGRSAKSFIFVVGIDRVL